MYYIFSRTRLCIFDIKNERDPFKVVTKLGSIHSYESYNRVLLHTERFEDL